MKKLVFGAIIFLILINVASAPFSCSDNKPINEDIEELNIGERKNINGVYLGLSKADETPVFNRWSAELFIDAQIANLINETPISKEFSDETDFSIILTRSTENEATIKIGNSNKTIKEDNLNEIITYNGRKYGVELFSASDENALIKVFNCNNASAEITKIVEETSETNSGNETENNDSSQNLTINNTQVNITNTTRNNSDNRTGGVAEEKTSKLINFIILSSTALIIIITLFVLIRILKNRE